MTFLYITLELVCSQSCSNLWRTLWKLPWPLPWRYRLPTPLDPLEIRDHPNMVHQRYYPEENYRRLRSFPLLETMVEAYNWKIKIGLRRGVGVTNKERDKALSWTLLVPPVDEWTSFFEDRAICNLFSSILQAAYLC